MLVNTQANRPTLNLAARPKTRAAAPRPQKAEPDAQAQAPQPSFLDGVGKFFGDIWTGLFGRTQDDTTSDGAHSTLAFQPKDRSAGEQERQQAANSRSSVLFVNGAGADLKESEDTAQLVGNKIGRNVELIHNATEIKKNEGGLLSPLLDGLGKLGAIGDVNQVVADHYGLGQNPAVDSLKAELLKRLSAGEQVDVIGHSQGNNIVARATKELAKEHPELEMGKLRVVNMAGPTRQSDYADGIGYSHLELDGDFVPRTLGEGIQDPNELALRDATYWLRASPLAIGWGFLNQHNNDHDPGTILDDGLQMFKLQRLFVPEA